MIKHNILLHEIFIDIFTIKINILWSLDGYFYIPYRCLLEKKLVNTHDGVWAISDIVIRTGYLPSVRQMLLPGHSNDERRRPDRSRFESKHFI